MFTFTPTQMTPSCTFTVSLYTETVTTAASLEQCMDDVGQWMAANRLKLNSDKTELNTVDWHK